MADRLELREAVSKMTLEGIGGESRTFAGVRINLRGFDKPGSLEIDLHDNPFQRLRLLLADTNTFPHNALMITQDGQAELLLVKGREEFGIGIGLEVTDVTCSYLRLYRVGNNEITLSAGDYKRLLSDGSIDLIDCLPLEGKRQRKAGTVEITANGETLAVTVQVNQEMGSANLSAHLNPAG